MIKELKIKIINEIYLKRLLWENHAHWRYFLPRWVNCIIDKFQKK